MGSKIHIVSNAGITICGKEPFKMYKEINARDIASIKEFLCQRCYIFYQNPHYQDKKKK